MVHEIIGLGCIDVVCGCGCQEGWCRGAELNCRHRDFQSRALPTELPRHGGTHVHATNIQDYHEPLVNTAVTMDKTQNPKSPPDRSECRDWRQRRVLASARRRLLCLRALRRRYGHPCRPCRHHRHELALPAALTGMPAGVGNPFTTIGGRGTLSGFPPSNVSGW